MEESQLLQPYRSYLEQKKLDLWCKKIFDRFLALLMIILLFPVIIFLAIWIKLDSPGEVFYRQERVTQNGRRFRIFKFRTMVTGADKKGSLVTLGNDNRITKVGQFIRRYRLDELPQLFNVLLGDMSFVGVRPEVPRYTDQYTEEMKATLLLPAGITSPASIAYKDEDQVMDKYMKEGLSADKAYINHVLPDKMVHNLNYIKTFTFWNDIKIMFQTVFAVLK